MYASVSQRSAVDTLRVQVLKRIALRLGAGPLLGLEVLGLTTEGAGGFGSLVGGADLEASCYCSNLSLRWLENGSM